MVLKIKFNKAITPDGEEVIVPDLKRGIFPCPVCGFPTNDPWYEPQYKTFSCDICPCCDFQPICDLQLGVRIILGVKSISETLIRLRKDWLMRWVNVEKVWIDELGGYTKAIDAIRQLKNINIYIDEEKAQTKEELLRIIEKM